MSKRVTQAHFESTDPLLPAWPYPTAVYDAVYDYDIDVVYYCPDQLYMQTVYFDGSVYHHCFKTGTCTLIAPPNETEDEPTFQ